MKNLYEYPQRVIELETELKLNTELCEVFRNEISRLKATLKQADEAYDIQGKQLLEALDEIEKLKEKNVDLGFESVRAFERGQKFPCNLNCDECTEKCRAWQNGHNATCERECDNCEVLKSMNAIAEVVLTITYKD